MVSGTMGHDVPAAEPFLSLMILMMVKAPLFSRALGVGFRSLAQKGILAFTRPMNCIAFAISDPNRFAAQ